MTVTAIMPQCPYWRNISTLLFNDSFKDTFLNVYPKLVTTRHQRARQKKEHPTDANQPHSICNVNLQIMNK